MAGLVLGCTLGVVGNLTGWAPAFRLSELLDPVGALWMGALQVAVVPLVVVQMMAAVLRAPTARGFGHLAGRTVTLIVVLLVGAAVVTALVSPGLVGAYTPPPGTAASIEADTNLAIPGIARAGGSSDRGSFLVDLLTGRHILPLLLGAVAAALILLRLPRGWKERVRDRVQRASSLLLHGVRWILYGTPAAVFAILLGMSLEAGLGAAGLIVVFIAMMSGLLIVATAVLYPLTFLLSGLPFHDFARALAPAQLVAVSTRSSIASLPALVDEAEADLQLPSGVTGMVLPLAVAIFKLNRPVSSTFQLIFLAHVFGVPLGPGTVATFIATSMLLSFSSVGVPGGAGGMRALPVYLAAGIPVQGYLLVDAAEDIPDIFKTLLNVTAYMSVAVIVTGRERIADTVS